MFEMLESLFVTDAIKAKYGDRWTTAYEEGKKSVNKMGPEITYEAVRPRKTKSLVIINDENAQVRPSNQ